MNLRRLCMQLRERRMTGIEAATVSGESDR
jgi:hypothetical protein